MPVLTRYDVTAGQREDILDMIMQLSPEETPFLSRLQVGSARQAIHSWLTDTIASGTATGGAAVEGAEATSRTLSDRTRITGYTQITNEVIQVSGTNESTGFYGLDSLYAYELEKGMKRWKIMVDTILWTSTSASGTASVARQLTGAIDSIQSNRVTGSAGSCAMTETLFNDGLQNIFNNGGIPSHAFCAGFNKRRISSFATSNARYSELNQQRMISNRVAVYESDFGTVEVVLERYIPAPQVAQMDLESWRLAYLRKPFVKPLAETGDYKWAMIIGEYTLESLAQSHNNLMSAFATSN